MSYLGKDRHDGLPKLNGHRSMDRNLTLLEDEIERLRFSRSAPPAGRSSSRPNSPGLGLGSPQPSGFQTKKMIQDLHDQVKLYKSELDKKDKLIQDLSRVESSTPYRRVHFSPEDKVCYYLLKFYYRFYVIGIFVIKFIFRIIRYSYKLFSIV
ncbi:uncharacterized protein LOC117106182 [Anneissia japonica]|uniref:uncharacterized protein LOC117106182 n=1 Tax=Anneissia japonica TaxID=1529436 RepID=UPI0014259443|nr:uncharacterized protein LOC117106182 [Anneissia japonica]